MWLYFFKLKINPSEIQIGNKENKGLKEETFRKKSTYLLPTGNKLLYLSRQVSDVLAKYYVADTQKKEGLGA